MTYLEKLKDPRWQKRRLEILNRDNWTCQLCESKEKTLHVHHKYYLPGKEPWEHPDSCLATLCHECHTAEGELNIMKPAFLNAWYDAGLFNVDMEGCYGHISSIRIGRDRLTAIISALTNAEFAERVVTLHREHLRNLPPIKDDLEF